MSGSNINRKKEIIPRPKWIKVRAPGGKKYHFIKEMLGDLNLATVCQEAQCPNIEECWSGGTATFMLMGEVCTRACKFCAVKTGNPQGVLDEQEPFKVGHAIAQMALNYVVLTSVNRDDLPDEGANHFAKTVEVIRQENPKMIVEVLTPDFTGRKDCIQRLVKASPHVFAHNLETVESLTPFVRDRRASYHQSLKVLKMVKELDPKIYTKTSIMLGLGESEEDVFAAMKDLRSVGCDAITFGQYLRPSSHHLPVQEYLTHERFNFWESAAMDIGFLYVASGPLVRSSYKAGEYFIKGLIDKGYTAESVQKEGKLVSINSNSFKV